MHVSSSVEFGHRDRKDIYDMVEREGTVAVERVRAELFPHDERRFRHQLALLKRDGYLEERDGELRVTMDDGGEEVFEDDALEYTIRPARQEDLGGILGVIRQVAEEREYIEAESVAEQLDHQDVLLRDNELESRVFFVATVEGEVVGWACVEALEMEKLRHVAELTFGVIEDYRGHGIGTRLSDRAVEWAQDHDFEKVHQSIPGTNQEAIDYLERRGCYVDAVREGHYKIGDDYVDEVMLARDLTG